MEELVEDLKKEIFAKGISTVLQEKFEQLRQKQEAGQILGEYWAQVVCQQALALAAK